MDTNKAIRIGIMSQEKIRERMLNKCVLFSQRHKYEAV